jgi:S-formylglutathione hydrolase FrmB
MRKLKPILTSFLCGLALSLNAQPVINILASFYSEALGEVKNVRIYLPHNYYSYPGNIHYPVIYYLHGWTGNHNSMSEMITYLQVLMTAGTIEPVIMVAADNWVEPFEGSFYTNSIIWGNYEDFMTEDLINWVDATFRTIPHKKARGFIGQSMGGHGAFRLTLRHKDKFSAFAANGPTLNFDLLAGVWQSKLQIENNGPPYSYSYVGGGPFTKGGFIIFGAAAPNPNSPQNYINPAIVEFMFDENCNLIDTVFQKVRMFDVIPLLKQTSVGDSIGILYCCGMADHWEIYDANAALADTLNALGLPYEFMSHTGGHGMPNAFKERALIFLDSLLMDPFQVNVGIAESAGFLKHMGFYPNPFTVNTTIEFYLPQTTIVSIQIFNAMGAKVAELQYGQLPAGQQQFTWHAGDLPKGLYFCRVQTGEEFSTQKLIKY